MNLLDNKKAIIKIIALSLIATTSVACSALSIESDSREFLDSGSIVISKVIDTDTLSTTQISSSEINNEQVMTPLIGFFPPTTAYVPALNETWLEVNPAYNRIKLHLGSDIVEEFKAEGISDSKPGNYFVTQKVENPIWRADDNYFVTRGLSVPTNENIRMRKGALGKLSIQTSNNLNIHSAALWTQEVGGLRVPFNQLYSIYEALPVGAPILVK